MNDICHKFEASLMDLVYGELPENEANELRGHVSECNHCRTLLEEIKLTRKIVSRLPMLNLEQSLSEATRRAAREFAETRIRKERRLKIIFLEEFRRFLPIPVVAAAAIALVAVAFILSYSQDDGEPAEKILARTELPKTESPGVERVPEEEVQPEDLRAESPANFQTIKPRGGQKLRKGRVERKSRTLGSRSAARPSSSALEAESEQPEINEFQGSGRSTVAAAPTQKSDEQPYASSSRKKEGVFATQPKRKSSRSRQVIDDDIRDEQAARPSAAMGQDIEADVREWGEDRDDFALGMAAYRRGDCVSAKEHFLITMQTAHGDQKPRAIHYLARCEKRRGRCGEAVKWYDRLLVDYRAYRDRGSALWEASQCHRRLGHIEKSRMLLRELSSLPGWEQKATKELEKLSE